MSDSFKETLTPDELRKSIPDEVHTWSAVGTHLQELIKISNLSETSLKSHLVQRAKLNTPLSFFIFLFRAFLTYLTVFILSPQTIILDPVGTCAALVIYPAIGFGLWIALFILWIFSALGGNQLVDWLGKKYARGYSVINWLNPDIFTSKESMESITASREWLNGSKGPTSFDDATPDSSPSNGSTRIFSLPLARTFLLMSSLVYERRDSQVLEAVNLALNDPSKLAKAEGILKESMQVIRLQAEKWGMRYEGLSDLASDSGPFASVFYNGDDEERPWLVVVFKGTTPTNFAEFLVDAAINRTPASVFLAGSVHEGFYGDLFPTVEGGGADGYGSILRRIKVIAGNLRQKHGGGPIPLWITGHSLGSALCSLLYSRFLLSPSDLGPHLELKDSYSYGTPRLGDGAFASAFEKASITPLLRENVLFRVVNNWDVVCRVPPGLADAEASRDLLGLSVFNYAHVGCETYLKRYGSPGIAFNISDFHQKTQVVIKDGSGPEKKRSGVREDSLNEAGWNPLRMALCLLPPFILDHFPASYYASLGSIDAKTFNNPEKAVDKLATKLERYGLKSKKEKKDL